MDKKDRRRRRRRILGAMAAGLLLTLWLVVFHSRLDIVPAAMSLPESVGPYRAAGFYWTTADLPRSGFPDSENAAGPLLEAVKTIRQPETLVGSRADVPAAKRELEKDVAALSFAETASHRPYLHYARDWDEAPYTSLKELYPEKGMIKALCLRARCEAYGDPSAMRADLSTALRLVKLFGQDSTLIAYLVQIACESIVVKAIEFCASLQYGKPAELSALGETLAQYPFHADLAKAMRDEAYFEVAALRNLTTQQVWAQMHPVYDEQRLGPSDEPPRPSKSELKRSGYPDSIVCRAFLARVLQGWTRAAPLLTQYQGDPEKLGKALDATLIPDEKNERASDMFAATIFPIFKDAGAAEVKARAMEKCTLALIGALEYRAKTGAYPTSIGQIPGRWADPFDGKPLHLKPTPGGIRVYSIGPDRIDAGGVDRSESEGKPFNIVAAYPPIMPKSYRATTQGAPGGNGARQQD